jgi:hypothetical protein
MKKLLILFMLCGAAMAQNMMTVTSTSIPNAIGGQLIKGEACVQPTDDAGAPISYKAPGGGQAQHGRVCKIPVANGVLSFQLPNVKLTNRTDVRFKLTVTDSTTGQTVLDKGYEALQPSPTAYWCSGSTCNLDNFIPSGPPGTMVTVGPQGSPGVSITWLGTFAAAPSAPGLNNAYYDSTQKKSLIWTGTAWALIAQDGAAGAAGTGGSGGGTGSTVTINGVVLCTGVSAVITVNGVTI